MGSESDVTGIEGERDRAMIPVKGASELRTDGCDTKRVQKWQISHVKISRKIILYKDHDSTTQTCNSDTKPLGTCTGGLSEPYEQLVTA